MDNTEVDASQVTINDRTLWRCNEFVSQIAYSSQPFLFDISRLLPNSSVEADMVLIGGWKFNIISTVHRNAKSNDIPNGLKLLSEHAPNMIETTLEIFY